MNNLNINRIKLPFTNTEINVSYTSSYIISDIINNYTLKSYPSDFPTA